MDKRINQDIKRIKTEKNDILAQETEKNYEAGNKSTKLLAYRLKKQMANHNIYKITDSATNLPKYKTEKIHKCFESYYKNLYSQPKINNKHQIATWLDSLNLHKVTEAQNSPQGRTKWSALTIDQ